MEQKSKQIEIVQTALNAIHNAGIPYSIAPLWNASTNSIAIIIPGVVLRDGKLEEER